MNALFVFIAVVYFKKAIELFTVKKFAIIFSFAIGSYPPIVRYLPVLFSEPLSFMVICGLQFYICRLYKDENSNWKYFLYVSIFLGFLILVKVIFFHVLIVSFLAIGVMFLLKKSHEHFKTTIVLLGAFLFISPYLIYTYSLIDIPFFLGAQGGEILYHRATTYDNEYGNWFSRNDVINGVNDNYKPKNLYSNLKSLSDNHRDVYLKLEGLSHIERDSAFKSIAIANMKAHPTK